MKIVKYQAFCALLLVCSCAHQAPVSPAAAPAPAKAEAVRPKPERVNHWTTDWTPIFDGTSLKNWAITDFAGHGPVNVSSNQINLGMGDELSGITWTNGTLPKTDYEITLEAMKVDGSDYFSRGGNLVQFDPGRLGRGSRWPVEPGR